MKRLLKVLTGHSNAIDSLEKKLKQMSEGKKKIKAKAKPGNRLPMDEDPLMLGTGYQAPQD